MPDIGITTDVGAVADLGAAALNEAAKVEESRIQKDAQLNSPAELANAEATVDQAQNDRDVAEVRDALAAAEGTADAPTAPNTTPALQKVRQDASGGQQ